jgi:LuxR family transcriptional regulator, maltose regulon positive regulatory protein
MEYVLHTKLMPPRLQASTIQRDDLLKRMDNGLGRKLTLVTAPTGFGKTTLVSMWIASRNFASAWVTLDENDNDPSRFWTYVVSALRTFDSVLGKSALSALNAPQLPSFQTLLTPLMNDLAKLTEPCVLILEDFHAITSKEINESFSFLIQNLPDALHLLLITRTNPDLPLPLLRARNELLEIDTNDLRFNLQESESFLRTSTKTEISSSAIDSLFQKTEGWAAGLQLAALSLQNKNTEDIQKFVETFSGSHRYISDYLIKEAFESQSETVRDFLLKTCFLKGLTASLCNATAEIDNSTVLLEHLERDSLFLVRLEQGGSQIWYRYNHLFAESIQLLARQRLDERAIQSLFERASDWYEYHGLLEDAIETALTAKLFERAMTLIEKYLEIHDLRELHTLSRWLELIPRQDVLQHPAICFTFSQIILYSEDRFAPATAVKIEPFLSAAESIWRAQEDHSRVGQLLSFRGNVAWWQGNFPKAFEYARQSLGELPESEIFWCGNSLLIISYEALNEGRILDAQDLILEARALLGAAQNIFGVLATVQLLGEVFYLQGELEQAEQLNQQILTDAVGDESMLDDRGIASLSLANIAYERNDLEEAERFAMQALDLGKQRANEMLQVQATIRLARIYSAHGNLSGAHELVKSMEAGVQNPSLLRELQNAQALFSIHENNISTLEWWVKVVTAENQNTLHMQKEHEAFTLARLRILEGKPKDALAQLEYWKTDSTENGRVRSRVEGLVLEALAYHADSNPSRATEQLVKALTLGQAKGFRRLFLDEGTRMAALIQASLSSLPNRTLSLFATTLMHSFPAEATAHLTVTSSTVHIEALSQQEVRVLRLLVAGLSNTDIARELVVSNNTIKTHVKSIYRKLNVSSRDEARELAKELKLL